MMDEMLNGLIFTTIRLKMDPNFDSTAQLLSHEGDQDLILGYLVPFTWSDRYLIWDIAVVGTAPRHLAP
jgi:hypothetical protein